MALFIHQCDSGGNPNSLSARSLKERARAHMSPLARQPNAEEAGPGKPRPRSLHAEGLHGVRRDLSPPAETLDGCFDGVDVCS